MESFRYRYRKPSTEKGEDEGEDHDGIGDEQKRVFGRRLHFRPDIIETRRKNMIKKADLLSDDVDIDAEELRALEAEIDSFLKRSGIPCRFGASDFSKAAVKVIKEKYETIGGYTVQLDHFGPEHDLEFS